jgi:hypothetical protein
MSKVKHRNKSNPKSDAGIATTTTTNLPGLKGIQVIVPQPIVIKENSSKPSKG